MDDNTFSMIAHGDLGSSRESRHHHDQQSSSMNEHLKERIVLFGLHFCYIFSFVLIVTSICTSSWYTTHPLAPIEQTSYGSFGVIEHCDKLNDVCKERKKVLQFQETFWPYRPLRNKDFDTTLLLLIISLVCTVIALALTFLLRDVESNHNCCLKWILLITSIQSVIFGVSSIIFLDTQVRDDKMKKEKFRHGWSSHVIWLSVGLSTLLIIPVVYLLRLKPITPTIRTSNDCPRDGRDSAREYILPQNTHHYGHRFNQEDGYSDINFVE